MIDADIDPVIAAASFEGGGPNTLIAYLYRDADNFKQCDAVILDGALTLDQAIAIVAATDLLDGFVPSAVGMPDLQERTVDGWQPDQDHPFHELTQIALVREAPTVELAAAQFHDLFVAADWEQEGARVVASHAAT